MQVFFVLTTGTGLLLIFTIDNLSENTIVSVSSAAEFSPRTCIGLPAI